MDGDEAKESAPDFASVAVSAMCLDVSCEHESTQPARKQQKRKRASSELDIVDKESASAEWQQEIDALYEYYKEVSGHHLNPEELACLTGDSNIACLLEESSLPCAKLTDKIYKRMKLQDGVTESSVRNSVLNIGRRSSYGICAMDVDELEDESDSCLWCWETLDLALLPSHLHSSLSIRRTARKLIHERILSLSGKLAAKDAPNTHTNQNSCSVNAVEVQNLDEICSYVEKSKEKTDADITKMQSKTKAQEEQATRKAVKEQQMMARQIENEQKKKDMELKHMKEKAEREAKSVERENKRLKKHQEEVERAKKRKEKEEAELKRKASTKKQANFMEGLFIRKRNNNMESSGNHYLEKTINSKSSGTIEELPVAATLAMDCTLSQANHLRVGEFWVEHVSRWRKLSQHNRLHHWCVRRSPKVQLFLELKLQKSSATAPSDNMPIPIKEQSSQESTGSIDFSKLLDELKISSHGKNIHSRTVQNSISSSAFLVKKLLQFDRSFRPAYYGTWRKKSSTVSGRQPFQRDPELNYDVESDEEWEEEDSGERLSDFEEDDETMNERDYVINVEEETENSFVVPDGDLSGDEGMQYEPVSVKYDESCSMLSNPGVTDEQRFLHRATEDALKIDMPLVISNLDHRKLDLKKAEGITAEKVCLQALCMKKYPSGPIIDVPVVAKVTIEDQEFRQSNKKSPRTPVPSKSISESDMPEFAKLVTSCSHGMGKLVDLLHERFPCVSKLQLKNKVREIADFTHNRWQVKKDILDMYSVCLSPDKVASPKCAAPHSSQHCLPPDEPGKSGESSPCSALKSEVSKQQIGAEGVSNN